MKRLIIFLLVAGMFLFCSNDAFARAIGLKINYNYMMGDYDDMEADNNFSGGLFYEYGVFGFQSLIFKPGIDWVKIEGERNDRSFEWGTVIGLHFDWYYYFMDRSKIAPFVGFGPAFNYILSGDDDDNTVENTDDDSDVGIEVFGGCEFDVASNITIIAELRFVIHDIANIDQQLFKPSVGVSYSF